MQVEPPVAALRGGERTGALDEFAGQTVPPVLRPDVHPDQLGGGPRGVALGDLARVRRVDRPGGVQRGGGDHLLGVDGDQQGVPGVVQVVPLEVDHIGVPLGHIAVAKLAVEGVEDQPARPGHVLRRGMTDHIRKLTLHQKLRPKVGREGDGQRT